MDIFNHISRQSYIAVQFIDRTITFYTQVTFGHFGATNQAGLALITCFGVNFERLI